MKRIITEVEDLLDEDERRISDGPPFDLTERPPRTRKHVEVNRVLLILDQIDQIERKEGEK
jgi:hypothetical protein